MCEHPFHKTSLNRRTLLGAVALSWIPASGFSGLARADAEPVDLPPPSPADTCPVCGMFVARYPEWIATIVYEDGFAAHFDGAKDFFKYLHDFEKYAPGRTRRSISGMGVTDYYAVERIAAADAFYVIGSDVLGPMGHELVPHARAADAGEFTTDHAGRRVLTFDEVAMPLLIGLDEGRFE